MSNSKVRIYDLSKDLNLDNQRILAVCEQLNILVKSHSSTITDAEAEMIRNAVENLPPSPASPSKPQHHTTHAAPTRGQTPPVMPKKQEILEVRRIHEAVVSGQPTASSPVPMVKPTPIAPPSPPTLKSGVAPVAAPVAPATSVQRPVRPVARATVDAPAQLTSPERVDASAPAATPQGNNAPPPPSDPSPGEGLLVPSDPVAAVTAFEPPATLEPLAPAQPQPESSPMPAIDTIVSPPARPEVTQPSPPAKINKPPSRPEVTPVAPTPRATVDRPVLKTNRPIKAGQTVAGQAGAGAGTTGGPNAPNPNAPKEPARETVATASPPAASPRPVLPKPSQLQNPKPAPAKEKRSDSGEGNAGAPHRRLPRTAEDDPSRDSGVAELHRPKLKPVGGREVTIDPKPVRPPAAGGTVPVEVAGVPALELKERPRRPSLTSQRVGKRDDWEDEEEEVVQKSAKVGGKSKRRGQNFLEDDEDEVLRTELLSAPSPLVRVSLSLERPARPKNKVSQVKPPTAPTRKSASGESSDRNRNRRERREEVEIEKPTRVVLPGSITVQELAHTLMVPETEVIKVLFMKGVAANINQTLELDTATMVAQELGVEVEQEEKSSAARKVEMLDIEDLENLHRRPPVVTIMGHVDHGKTTLLDAIRKTKVAQGEAGGITQHIGAYHVDVEYEGKVQQVVFLDTPGHEAFTAMRARGARVTDIAVLVVAADDGVQPQTIEAISHAKAAGVPIVVAINKIDKEGAQPDRVKQELTEFGLLAEEWGGDTSMVPVSAIRGENLDALLEMILLVAELEDLSANPDRPAKGTVIEAHLDKSRGPVATLLVQNGTLRVGDILVAGSAIGKVRAMVDDRLQRVEAASPSFAVEVLGLDSVPAAGDEFDVFADEKDARAVVTERLEQQRQSRLQQQALAARRVTLNTLSARAQEGELKELNLILKADVQGSVEAILGALQQLPQNEVQIRILLAAPGEVTQTDIDLAAASSAVILGFNTTFASGARHAADELGVDVREYNIIYKLLDDVQGAMEGLLEPELVEEPLGQVEVRAVFPVGKGTVAGCYILSGKAIRNCSIRVRRGNQLVYEGNLDSLKRMRDDVKEVNAGYECGIGVNNFNAWEIGDIIETFRMVTKRRTLSAH